MKSEDKKIQQGIRNFRAVTSSDLDSRIDAALADNIDTKPLLGLKVIIYRLAAPAAAACIMIAVFLSLEIQRSQQQTENVPLVTIQTVDIHQEKPSPNSYIALNNVFSDGDLESLENQLNKSSQNTVSGPVMVYSIEYALCELLGDC